MTEQQQAIIALFNTKDAANIEIAQECAISTGLGRWFSRYINKLIAKIKSILELDSCITIYSKFDALRLYIGTKRKQRLAASALAFFAFDLHSKWCECVVFDGCYGSEDNLEVTFDYDFYDTIAELKSLGCCFLEF